MVDEYRKITAEMTGNDLEDWHPEKDPVQRDKIQDVIYDRGMGIKTLEIKSPDGGIIQVSVKIFKGDDMFIGDARDRETAFMDAFMQWCEWYQS
jgi:hypothetical protein